MKFTIVRGLISWFLVFITCPVSIPILLSFGLIRSSVIILSKLFRPDLITPIKGTEISFTADHFWTRPRGANAFVWIVNGPLDISIITQRIKSIFLDHDDKTPDKYTRFTTHHPAIWLNVPFWKKMDKTFSVEDHLIAEDSQKIQSEDDLNNYLCNYLKSPFKSGKPCWDILIIHNFGRDEKGGGRKSVFAFRIHHIVGDGFTMLTFLEKVVDSEKIGVEADKQIIPLPLHEKCTKNDRQLGILKFKILKNLFWTPLTLYQIVQDFFIHSDFLSRRKKSEEIVLSSTEIPLRKIKQIRRNFDCESLSTIATYNHILSGALSEFFLKEYSHPVDLRSTNLIASLPLGGNGKHPGFGNHWTHGIFRLPLSRIPMEKRRKIILDNCKTISKLRLPQIYQKFPSFYCLIPFCAVKAITAHNMGAPIGLTNLPGPTEQTFLGGQRVLRKMAVVGLQWKHAAMSVGCFSYNGSLSVTILANKDIIPNQEKANLLLQQNFHQQIQNLSN